MKLRSQVGAMPTWLKVVIGLFVAGIVGIVVFIGGIVNMAGQMLNPNNAAKVAHQFVQIDDPLPAGWKYAQGLDVANMKMVAFNNSSTSTMVILIELPNPKHLSVDQLAAEHGSRQGRLQDFVVASRGNGTFAGLPMAYVRGISTSKSGRQSQTELRFVALPGDKAVTVSITESKAPAFDPMLPQPLLDRVKGFN